MNLVTFAAVVIPVAALQLYVAPFLPLLTAWWTQRSAPGWLKVSLTAVLAVVVAAVTTSIDSSVDLILEWEFLGSCVIAFGEAMLGYLVLRRVAVDPVAEQTAARGLNWPIAA